MYKLDVKVGDVVEVTSTATIYVEHKSGQRTRWAIDAPPNSVKLRTQQEKPAAVMPRKLPPLIR